jgi:hypothetical protein
MSGVLGAFGIFVLAFAIVIPFYTVKSGTEHGSAIFRPISTHDMEQHLVVMEQFDKVLRSGTLYPRWLPDFNRGYGSPWSNFYPGGFYYLSSLANLLTGNWMLTFLLLSGLGLALSAMAFYLSARDLFGRGPAFGGALLYMLAPYHLIDLYWRGAFPEFLAFVLIPPIFYFASRLGSRGGRLGVLAGFSLSYAALVIVHPPEAILAAYTLTLYALVRALLDRNLRLVFWTGLGMVIAFALSAIYLIPSLEETKYLDLNALGQPWNALFVHDDTFLRVVGASDSFGTLLNASLVSILLILLAGVAVAIHMTVVGPRSKVESDSPRRRESYAALIMGLAAILMCTPLSKPISHLLPKIQATSFAWRWLLIASFFACMTLSSVVKYLGERLHPRAVRVLVSIGAAVAVAMTLAASGWVLVRSFSNPPFDQPSTRMDSAYTPKNAAHPDALPTDTPEAEIIPLNGFLSIKEWSPGSREFTVAAVRDCELRIRSYNFPGWTARIDGSRAEILPDKLGSQVIAISPGNHKVEVTFQNTPPRSIGSAISGAALMLIVVMIALDIRHKRKREAHGSMPLPGSEMTKSIVNGQQPAD